MPLLSPFPALTSSFQFLLFPIVSLLSRRIKKHLCIDLTTAIVTKELITMSCEYNLSPCAKIFYRPIEASIRWSGLVQFEAQIVKELGNDILLFPPALAKKWPTLSLNTERIIDALLNGELRYSKQGIACKEPMQLNDSRLTIRHIDLKNWMMTYYPHEKPDFLFNPLEQKLYSSVTVDTVQILLAELETTRIKSKMLQEQLTSIQQEYHLLNEKYAMLTKLNSSAISSERSENTYLIIIGALLSLLCGQSPSGKAYSVFKTQEAIISALIAYYGEKRGISKSTLESKFAEARRRLNYT
ncbi:hypothetical protein [Brenneria tiliae]|uniref:Receptor protein-tyrosine kinase n=1 Tax=Brenneria tiliae TaxID=2914984 RepID=A0ABT0MQI1_9GAMM|nr:hypothetical protein [Brenneria tiliae]MCL2892105.1 hypothetical protein [Brenneria tiliae]